MIRFAHCALAALLLPGCASAPTQYLTLIPAAAGANTNNRSAEIAVVSVTIPGQVDQPELVIRQADGSMALLESERWIAPLGEEIRTALTLALSRQWQRTADSAAPAQDSALSARVNVEVQRFDSVPGQYALLEAAWALEVPGSPVKKAACRSSIRIPVAAGYPALAKGHQAAIDALASQICAQVRQLRASGASCDAAQPASVNQ